MKYIVLPTVLPDGGLQFDVTMPHPKVLPHFKSDPNFPGRFWPDFEPCQYRTLAQAPLTSAPG